MSELKPCPFCGGEEPNPLEHDTDCYYRMFYEMMLPRSEVVYPEEKLREAWNTRHERTCEFIPFVEESDDGYCSKCWALMYEQDNYCPNCGARVKEG